MLAASVSAQVHITFAWDYPTNRPDIVFNVWLATNAAPQQVFRLVASVTNSTVIVSNVPTCDTSWYVTASNTVRKVESPPSNIVIVGGIPLIPGQFRLLSITFGP